jgi:hypothetical protein
VLIIHHRSEKSENDYRGSSDIRAAVDSAWLLARDDRTKAGDALGRLLLKPYKTRSGPKKAIRIQFNDGAFLPLDGPLRPPLDIALELVACHPGSTQKDLINFARGRLGERRLVDALTAAGAQRRIEVRPGKSNAYLYYPISEPAKEELRVNGVSSAGGENGSHRGTPAELERLAE